MRLGAYKCELTEGSKAYEAYGQKEIQERHRHRYEFNSKYREDFEKAGMITTGINPESGLTEIVEIPAHKWFVGVQFHPESIMTPCGKSILEHFLKGRSACAFSMPIP